MNISSSSLNFDLFVKNISDSPLCLCGSIENAQHIFFHCTINQAQRNELINAISPYQYPSLYLFLYGDLSMPQDVNSMIFEKVYKYIISTKRFKANIFAMHADEHNRLLKVRWLQ